MAMATEMTDERLAAIKAAVEKAHRELGEVCSAGVSRRWRMSIPADFTRDSDLIIGDGLRGANELAAEVERLRAALASTQNQASRRELAISGKEREQERCHRLLADAGIKNIGTVSQGIERLVARLSAVPAADVERMREALEFYADDENWEAFTDEDGNEIHNAVPMASQDEEGGEVFYCDCGDTARAALASPASGAAETAEGKTPGQEIAEQWAKRMIHRHGSTLGWLLDEEAELARDIDAALASPPSPAPTGTADQFAAALLSQNGGGDSPTRCGELLTPTSASTPPTMHRWSPTAWDTAIDRW
jgi:hypothetical protein